MVSSPHRGVVALVLVVVVVPSRCGFLACVGLSIFKPSFEMCLTSLKYCGCFAT